MLTIASVITCFIFLLNEAFHTRERLDDEQEGAAMWKTPQPEENSLRKLQNEEPRSMAAPEEEYLLHSTRKTKTHSQSLIGPSFLD